MQIWIDVFFSVVSLSFRDADSPTFPTSLGVVTLFSLEEKQIVDFVIVRVCVCMYDDTCACDDDGNGIIHPSQLAPHSSGCFPHLRLPHSCSCWVSAASGTRSCSDFTEAICHVELFSNVLIWCSVGLLGTGWLCGVVLQRRDCKFDDALQMM